MSKILIIHGGGPTAVMNCSLYGAIDTAKKSGAFEEILGAKFGISGAMNRDFYALHNLCEKDLEKLLKTPGSAIGTSRDPMEEKDYENLAKTLSEEKIDAVLLNGGNGTMDTAGKFHRAAKKYGIKVMGIPKTMDNDLSVIDHAPGYGSAAKFIAHSTKELIADVRSLPIHVVVMEALGRNAGWVTAASALSKDEDNLAPDMILLPEVLFDEDDFLDRVSKLWSEKKGLVVVCSEGLRDADEKPIVKPIFETGRSVYFGDTSSHLAEIIVKNLNIKARAEKPGLLGRASIYHRSQVDIDEATEVGRLAVKAILDGNDAKMCGIFRKEGLEYEVEYRYIPLEEVMLTEKTLPEKYIDRDNFYVTDEFVNWARPIVGKLDSNYMKL
ncbi:MAG: diphosphate--fructose-6-phosphate 1-phosphotransferase [Tissierellia bacterium]|nr:diphosphate--fructose-6-phosphate 1-phosphotransferase [Tissierellia bacterium]